MNADDAVVIATEGVIAALVTLMPFLPLTERRAPESIDATTRFELDSLLVVNLLLAIEDRLFERCGRDVRLVDDVRNTGAGSTIIVGDLITRVSAALAATP